jgi:hypothetical protein
MKEHSVSEEKQQLATFDPIQRGVSHTIDKIYIYIYIYVYILYNKSINALQSIVAEF